MVSLVVTRQTQRFPSDVCTLHTLVAINVATAGVTGLKTADPSLTKEKQADNGISKIGRERNSSGYYGARD